MPPSVARLAVEMSGANRSRCGASAAFSSSRTMPGSTRAHRSSTFTSSRRLRYFEVSTTRPAPIAWPACDVPPPRIVIETAVTPAGLDDATRSVARLRKHDAERLNLVDAGVGRVERARDGVEPHLAIDRAFELAPERGDIELGGIIGVGIIGRRCPAIPRYDARPWLARDVTSCRFPARRTRPTASCARWRRRRSIIAAPSSPSSAAKCSTG